MKNILLFSAFCFSFQVAYSQGSWENVVWTTDGLNLSIFNPEECNYEFIGEITGEEGTQDITFTPNGKLYGIGLSNNVFEIDTGSALPTEICTLPSSFWGHPSLTGLNDSILITDFMDTLWSININTCELRSMGKIGYNPRYEISETGDTLSSIAADNSDGDLVWCGGKLYAVAWNRLFEIVLNDDQTEISSSTLLNPDEYNMPISTGLATINGQDGGGASSSGEHLLSFGYYLAVFTIDPSTAMVDTFCSYTDEDIIAPWGATVGPRYIWNDTTTTDTVPPTSINAPQLLYGIDVYPNPTVDNQVNIHLKPGLNIRCALLYNTTGSRYKLSLEQKTDNEFILNLPPQRNQGIYIIEIQTDKGIFYKKIAIE